jgi:hypothetical protein
MVPAVQLQRASSCATRVLVGAAASPATAPIRTDATTIPTNARSFMDVSPHDRDMTQCPELKIVPLV